MSNNNNNYKKTYLAHKHTLGELYDMYKSTYKQTIWSWENTTASEEEKERADRECRNTSRRGVQVWPDESDIERIVYKKTTKVLLSGYAGDIIEKIKEEVEKSEIKYLVGIRKDLRGDSVYINIEFVGDDDQEHETNVIDDVAKLDKELSDLQVVPHVYYRQLEIQPKYALLEVRFVTGSFAYYPKEDLDTILLKKIKALIKKKFTYCIKRNKNIVPQEYLDRGEAGIREWQTLKQSQNKNNSMEKKLITSSVREKKDFLHRCNNLVMSALTNSNISWDKPRLEIGGQWSTTRTKKLEVQLLGDRSKQDVMTTDKEELLRMCKDYWRDQLEQSIKRVDEITMGDINYEQ